VKQNESRKENTKWEATYVTRGKKGSLYGVNTTRGIIGGNRSGVISGRKKKKLHPKGSKGLENRVKEGVKHVGGGDHGCFGGGESTLQGMVSW